MKIIVRALALGMLITGFAADHYVSAKTTSAKTMTASNTMASNMGPGDNCNNFPFCLR